MAISSENDHHELRFSQESDLLWHGKAAGIFSTQERVGLAVAGECLILRVKCQIPASSVSNITQMTKPC